jgi:hypothetical protein
MWIDTTTATNWILYIYDGADNIQIATINTSTNTVNFTDSALDVLTDTTPQLGGNLDVNGNSIVSTSNTNITLAPDGTGDVVLSADTVKIGDSNANATITTDGTGDLILNTNSGSSSGSITIADGANANITIEPNGTGDILLNADTVRVGDSGANATITSNGAGDLILNTNSGTDSGSITIADGANGNITVAGNGTGQIVVNAGAVGTPVIAPTGDLNTGIFFPSADTIAFTEGGTEAMRINSDGNVALAKNIGLGGATPTTSGTGITFPATQSASTDANTLDDYEEGTWTPTYVPTGTNFTSITYTIQNGRYTKIGRLVTVIIFLRTASITKGSASGNIKIESLPFPVGDGAASTGVVSGSSNWLGDYPLSGISTGSSIFLYYRDASDGGDNANNVGDIQTTADGNDIYLTITYST